MSSGKGTKTVQRDPRMRQGLYPRARRESACRPSFISWPCFLSYSISKRLLFLPGRLLAVSLAGLGTSRSSSSSVSWWLPLRTCGGQELWIGYQPIGVCHPEDQGNELDDHKA